jgi:methyl-accepting chemotaxis protein
VLSRLKIASRLAIGILVPLVIVIAFAGYNLALKWDTRSDMARLVELADGVAQVSRLIHELQRERGASAVFVGSKGAQLREELPAQRSRTDKVRQPAVQTLARLAASGSDDLKQAIAGASSAVAALDRTRSEINAFSITAPASNTYFTETVATLLAVTGEIARVSDRGDVAAAISAYVSFMNGKERAGQERAVGAAGVSTGKFELDGYRRVLGLAAMQEAYFNAFEAAATPAERGFFKSTMSGKVVDDVVRMRTAIATGGLTGDMPGVTGTSWFNATTARIDTLKTVEDRIADGLEARVTAVLAEADRALVLVAGITLMVLLASGAIVLLVARSITRPLSALSGAMNDLAAGAIDREIPGLDRRDEIGAMAGAVEIFKQNAVERQRLAAEAEETRMRTAEQRRAEMQQLADTFQAAVGHIVETVSSASGALESDARAMSATAEGTQQLSGVVATASEQASANVQSVASATEEMTSSVGEISRQVQESSTIANEAVKQAETTDARISALSQAASRIGDVVKLITAIAEQTNLLALNATIEAARAGEAGRGFAVVASEVKTLASQTAKATEEIGTQIANMQAATQESVSAIKEIGATITRVSEIAATIAAAVEEQGAATQEIARNVQEAATGTAQVAANIADVNRGAGETGSASARVLASARSLAGENERLKAEVEKFLDTVRAA